MIRDDETFVAKDRFGKEKTYQVMFTFDCEELGRSYIVYSDGSRDWLGRKNVFASIYDPKATQMKLTPIKTEEEWEMVESTLEDLKVKVRRGDYD